VTPCNTVEADSTVEVVGCAGGKNLERRLQNEDVDLAIRSESGNEQVVAVIPFVSSPKRSPE
jgi:hypothetical protein